MKSIIKLFTTGIIICLFSSCSNTKIAVGNADINGPTYKVNSEWNHHLLWGLVPLNNAKMRGGDYVGNRADYVVKTNTSFLNGLVGFITGGIYSPTTTTYYLPVPEEGLFSTGRHDESENFYTKKTPARKTPPAPHAKPTPEPKPHHETAVETPEEVVTFNIYFRNGSTIKGEIVEKQEDITTIRTLNGRIARYRNSDISRIVREND